MMTIDFRRNDSAPLGFTMLELMIALVLGALLLIGLTSLFSTTSNSSRLQDGLARLQENGRYAISRMEADLRMANAQFCTNKTGNAVEGSVSPMWSARAPMVYAESLNLPDSRGDGEGNMNSVSPMTADLTSDAASSPYALSPRFFVQGYSCSSGTCSPALPTGLPTQGVAAGQRVPRSDVLTVRYQRGTGWPVSSASCSAGGSIALAPVEGDDYVTVSEGGGGVPVGTLDMSKAFTTGDLALFSDCNNPVILPITVSGSNLTANGLSGAVCNGSPLRDFRVFNFTKDFVTVTYFLVFRADESNSERLIPTLVRRENGQSDDLVQGIDRLDFRYAVQNAEGRTSYVTADEVNASTSCSPAAPDVTVLSTGLEPGCAWRNIRAFEVHLLVSSVEEIRSLDDSAKSYRYSFDAVGNPVSSTTYQTTLPSGLPLGSMMRREFIAQIASRNNNP
jgi:type IV pilus assembly protein PilW